MKYIVSPLRVLRLSTGFMSSIFPWLFIAAVAFAESRDATERLIAYSLVSGGKRLVGADGVYFSKLKLTAKGVWKAIQQRNAAKDKKASAEKNKPLLEKIEKLME